MIDPLSLWLAFSAGGIVGVRGVLAWVRRVENGLEPLASLAGLSGLGSLTQSELRENLPQLSEPASNPCELETESGLYRCIKCKGEFLRDAFGTQIAKVDRQGSRPRDQRNSRCITCEAKRRWAQDDRGRGGAANRLSIRARNGYHADAGMADLGDQTGFEIRAE